MSIKEDLGQNYKNLSTMLEPYLEDLASKDHHLEIKGKTIELANREQPQWLSYYDERRIELYTLVKFFEAEIARVRSKLMKGMEQYPRELSDRMKDKYIDDDELYLSVIEKYLAVKEVYGLYDSLVECFKARGYALNNITKIRVSSLEDVIL